MVPSSTLSATASATACCAGPNICTACLAPLIVTLLNRIVFGLVSRFGATTASSDVKPSLLLVSAWQNAVSAAEPRGPIEQVDVSDLVALADERLSYQDAIDLGHAVPPMSGIGDLPTD